MAQNDPHATPESAYADVYTVVHDLGEGAIWPGSALRSGRPWEPWSSSSPPSGMLSWWAFGSCSVPAIAPSFASTSRTPGKASSSRDAATRLIEPVLAIEPVEALAVDPLPGVPDTGR